MKNGIVIPCYNEAERLDLKAFQTFLNSHNDYIICFVNDGSQDETLDMLYQFMTGQEHRVFIHDMGENQGKAEAVRGGVKRLLYQSNVETIGFMDADLSTGFGDYKSLIADMETSNVKMIFGSRKSEVDNNISRTPFRNLMSNVVGLMIRLIVRLPIHDTQCGAKIFKRSVAQFAFDQKFLTRWLFDVEIFLRMRKAYGRRKVMTIIKEKVLKQWVHVEGSKITTEDALRIPTMLLKIAFNYEVKPVFFSLVALIPMLSFGNDW